MKGNFRLSHRWVSTVRIELSTKPHSSLKTLAKIDNNNKLST